MTNDDKDLKACPFCGQTDILAEFGNQIGHNIMTGRPCPLNGHVFTREAWNARSTPQQPSEPLKELDEEKVMEVICDLIDIEHMPCDKDCLMRGSPRELSKKICAKFGQPSEKKALSLQDIESIIETTSFNRCEAIYKKPYAQAIFDALPARKEVKWPLEYKPSPHNDGRDFYISDFEAGANEMLKACKKAYEEALPAQREVRYPTEDEIASIMESVDASSYSKKCGFPARYYHYARRIIDEFKKLNGG